MFLCKFWIIKDYICASVGALLEYTKEQSVLPEDDRVIETCRSVFKSFNVNFRLLKTIYVHLFECY